MKTATTLFSPKEREVIHLLVEEGLTAAEIADAMRLSLHTVAVHRHNINHKINQFLGYKGEQRLSSISLALFAVTHELVNMRTIIDRYSPVELAEPVSA